MNLTENIKLALEGLLANKMRALLTMLGIIIGISSVIAITSVGDSISQMIDGLNGVSNMKVTNYSIEPAETIGNATVEEKDYFTDKRISRYRQQNGDNIKGIGLSTDIGAASTVDLVPNQNLKVTGVNPDYFTVQKTKMSKGRTFNNKDLEGSKNVIVISSITSKRMFGNTADPLGKEIKVKIKDVTETFYIVGVYEDPKESEDSMTLAMSMAREPRFDVYIPYTTAKRLANDTTEGYKQIMVGFSSNIDTNEFNKKSTDFFQQFYPENSSAKFIVGLGVEELTGSLSSITKGISVGISVVAGISLVVGGIGVMNIMLVSVTERTREIGVRKALGAPNSAIQIQFLIESIIICTIGGVFGILLGIGFGSIAGALMNLTGLEVTVVPSLKAILLAVSFSMAIGIFFGYYPANKAAKMDPIEALRYE